MPLAKIIMNQVAMTMVCTSPPPASIRSVYNEVSPSTTYSGWGAYLVGKDALKLAKGLDPTDLIGQLLAFGNVSGHLGCGNHGTAG